ncbi:predicted protein [Methanosarcina acetivorans C2A]|uniref:Uncharacterized protein n=1 Tax=Methanosarcina acetivorans (strain ATCC 35395 / DSM 2834 / JCM 12185 / C2A) TaxID=188937 RepID=Q8TP00_METAC|nr:predicted protein [Methanosarcina acetivorans C2A]
MRYTLLLAPLGVMQAISSTTSFFVLFFGIILSPFFPNLAREEISIGSLMQKIRQYKLRNNSSQLVQFCLLEILSESVD